MNNPDSKIPSQDEKNDKILSKVFTNEHVIEAKKRAKELIKRASLNEALVVVDELKAEVINMVMPDRLSKTSKPSENPHMQKGLHASLSGLPENEYERKKLIWGLNSLENDIKKAIDFLEVMVLDIEAKKQQ